MDYRNLIVFSLFLVWLSAAANADPYHGAPAGAPALAGGNGAQGGDAVNGQILSAENLLQRLKEQQATAYDTHNKVFARIFGPSELNILLPETLTEVGETSESVRVTSQKAQIEAFDETLARTNTLPIGDQEHIGGLLIRNDLGLILGEFAKNYDKVHRDYLAAIEKSPERIDKSLTAADKNVCLRYASGQTLAYFTADKKKDFYGFNPTLRNLVQRPEDKLMRDLFDLLVGEKNGQGFLNGPGMDSLPPDPKTQKENMDKGTKMFRYLAMELADQNQAAVKALKEIMNDPFYAEYHAKSRALFDSYPAAKQAFGDEIGVKRQ